MSRRSMLFATTVCAVIVSLTAVNPASAFGGRGGFGGFVGGFGGGNFGRVAAFSGRSYGGGNFAPPSLSRFHAAPVANITAEPYFSVRHPEQPTQATSLIASNRSQQPFSGNAIAGGIPKSATPSAVAAARAPPAINQVGQTSGATNGDPFPPCPNGGDTCPCSGDTCPNGGAPPFVDLTNSRFKDNPKYRLPSNDFIVNR